MSSVRHHPLPNTSSTVKLSHMWAKHLIPAKTVKVHVESLHINGTVGCPSDTINDENGPGDGMDGVGKDSDPGAMKNPWSMRLLCWLARLP